jgi:tight adherence protein C
MGLFLGAAALLFLGLGLLGWRMVRDPGVAYLEAAGIGTYAGERAAPRASLVGRFLGFLDRAVGGRVLGQVTGQGRAKAAEAIARAGAPGSMSVESLIRRQASWAFMGAVAAVLLLANGAVVGLAMPVAGWFLPRFGLWSQGRARTAALERELPDFLDVLAVTISAGLGFRAALRRVATLVGGPVGEEMLVALRQIDLGASRRQAFEEMRERTAAPSLHSFVTAFLQAEELGTPLQGFLETYAKELRRTAGQRARTAAAKANPKISLILTLVIMPALSLFMIGSLALMAFGL